MRVLPSAGVVYVSAVGSVSAAGETTAMGLIVQVGGMHVRHAQSEAYM